jgi:hypothetical protein
VTLAMRYRYLGRSTRAGRDEALVELSGGPAPGQDAVGEIRGHAWIDTATGRVTLARAYFDVSAPVAGPDQGPGRVHFTLQAVLARAAGVAGPAPEIDASALPSDQPVMLSVFVR